MIALRIFLGWTIAAVASVFRERDRCHCGEPAADDGLASGLCEACSEVGPATLRPRVLAALGVGKE